LMLSVLAAIGKKIKAGNARLTQLISGTAAACKTSTGSGRGRGPARAVSSSGQAFGGDGVHIVAGLDQGTCGRDRQVLVKL
jgi:hypothetical protein